MSHTYIWQKKGWPGFTWQGDKLMNALSRARFRQGELLSKVRSLGMSLDGASRSEILVAEAMNTARIEGQKLDEEAVRSSVARRLNLPTAGASKEDRNAEGLIDVLLDATENYAKPLTERRLKSWQAALFPTGYSGLRRIRTGEWRGDEPMQVVSGRLGREKVHFEAPPHERLKEEMRVFLQWWEKTSKEMDGLLRAGAAHLYFVTIHPFEDGNGRVARALTDMALAQDENIPVRCYSLSARVMKERGRYYEALERAQKGSLDITDWLVWFLECYKRALDDSEAAIARVLNVADFWRTHAETGLNPNQRKAVKKLLEAGDFQGGLTTRKYVSMTGVSRATAFRDIDDLVEKGILVRGKAKGRSVSYALAAKQDRQ